VLKRLSGIAVLGALHEAGWIALYTVGPLRDSTVPFLILILSLFVLCFFSFLRIRLADTPSTVLVLLFALLFRLTLLPAVPHQSEDVYRYLWDARVASQGFDPFGYAPEAVELRYLRDATVYPMLNSKPYVTAYPPVSQVLFRLSVGLFGESVVAMKSVFSLLEFGALLIAWRLLAGMKRPLRPLILMAWNPFFIFEFSHSGHSDSGMIFLILLSVYLIHRSKPSWALVTFAGAVLAKLHPALWFPLYLRLAGWKAAAAGIAAGAGVAAVYFTPESLIRYVKSLGLYYRLFEFNAGIHYLLRYIGRALYDASWDQLTGPYLAAVLLAVSLLIWRSFPVRDAEALLHAGFWVMTADLCLSTTVHPWYLSWAALALPVFPYAFMFYWTGASLLSYMAYQYRPVFEPTWVLLVEYLPMYALMGWEIYRRQPLLAVFGGGIREEKKAVFSGVAAQG
jgi:hypothetical protein